MLHFRCKDSVKRRIAKVVQLFATLFDSFEADFANKRGFLFF